MRTLIVSVLTFALGCATGWYFGYTRPIARNSGRIAQVTGWTPAQISDAYKNPDETFRHLLGSQERSVAVISLEAFTWLEDGQSDRAKDLLAHRIADYYVSGYKADVPSEAAEKLHQRIEEVSEKSPTLKQAIEKRSK
jgi:hypothetical protein